jgi:hypothetical protein
MAFWRAEGIARASPRPRALIRAIIDAKAHAMAAVPAVRGGPLPKAPHIGDIAAAFAARADRLDHLAHSRAMAAAPPRAMDAEERFHLNSDVGERSIAPANQDAEPPCDAAPDKAAPDKMDIGCAATGPSELLTCSAAGRAALWPANPRWRGCRTWSRGSSIPR